MHEKTTVRHLLKRAPVTIREDDDLGLALQIMRWAEIRHLPVMRGELLRGVVSERDVLKRLAEVGQDAGAREKAGAVMNSPVITIGPDEPLEAAIERVNAWRIGCLPVIEKDRLLGIVTRSDLLDGAAALPEATPPPPAESPAALWPRATVEAIMSIDPATASADDTLATVVERMVRLGVRHVPVIDGDRKVIGVLSDRDVRTAIGNPMRALHTRDAIVRIESTRVSHAMSRSPVTVAAGTRLSEVAVRFVDGKVGILPVVDEQERLVGVVSYVDVLRAILGPKTQAN